MSYGSRRHVVDPASIAKERRRSRAAPQTHVQEAHTGGSNQALSQALHGGAPLDARVRAEMEARFGEPLDDVRIHNDADAHVNAAALQAKAYTLGTDIVFSAERYAPHSAEGKRLLAHELAHVVQQRRGGTTPDAAPESAHETDAAQAADQVVAGAATVQVSGASGIGIARDREDEESKKQPPRVKKTSKKSTAKRGGKAPPRVDPDIDADVERSFVEAGKDQPAPKNPKPARRAATKQSKDARKKFAGKMREGYAQDLSVGKGGQVHHGVEVQALKRYPGVFTVDEINAAEGMRGIPAEQGGKRQLHNSKIREVWDRHYRNLDNLIKQRGLKPGTKAYNDFVRKYLFDARAEMDYLYGQFFSEERAKAGQKSGDTETGTAKKQTAPAKKKPAPKQTAKKTAPKKKAASKKTAPKKKTAPAKKAAPKKKAAPTKKAPAKAKKPAAEKAPKKAAPEKKPAPKKTAKKAAPEKKTVPKKTAKKPVDDTTKKPAEKGKVAADATHKPAAPDKPTVDPKVSEPPAKAPEPTKAVEPAKTPPTPEAPKAKAPVVEHAPTVETPHAKVASGALTAVAVLGAIPAAKDIKREWEEGNKGTAVAKSAELGASFVPHLAPLFFAKGTIMNYWGPRHESIQKDSFAVGEAVEDVVEDIPIVGDIPYLPKLMGASWAANTAVAESVGYTLKDMGESIAEGAEDVWDWLNEPMVSEEEMQRLLKQMQDD